MKMNNFVCKSLQYVIVITFETAYMRGIRKVSGKVVQLFILRYYSFILLSGDNKCPNFFN